MPVADNKPNSRLMQRIGKRCTRLLQALEDRLAPVVPCTAPQSSVPPLPADDDVLRRDPGATYASSLFAELLLELPMHRRRLVQAHAGGDLETLRQAVHHLLGAVIYCDAPELEDALRELRLAIKTGDRNTIDVYQDRAINVLDCTLRYSGYRGQPRIGFDD